VAEDPRYDLFERVFIGLYETEGAERGTVQFFDIQPGHRAADESVH
jgi:hypothetical protein